MRNGPDNQKDPGPGLIEVCQSRPASDPLLVRLVQRLPPQMAGAAAATVISSEMRVVIAGGGIIGAACAYYLSKLGVRAITIVERATLACHSSGKAGGFLARDWGGAFATQSYDLHAELGTTLQGTDYRTVETLQVSMGGSGGGSVLPGWADRCAAEASKLGSHTTTAQVVSTHSIRSCRVVARSSLTDRL